MKTKETLEQFVEDWYEERWLEAYKAKNNVTIDIIVKLWERVFQTNYEDTISKN